MTTLKTQAEARIAADKAEDLKKRAARQAAKRIADPSQIEMVECVVLPAGDGKISMGEHVPPFGTAHYEEGEKFQCALPTAIELYGRGFVNFDGAREKAAEARESAKRSDMAAMAEDIALRKLVEQAEARMG